ncbi:MarR family winged helix-turn-helix transcriptional regulator [Actinomycetota bacterium]
MTKGSARRRRSIRHVQDSLRRLNLASNRYISEVARETGMSTADVHAIGVLKQEGNEGHEVTAGSLGRAVGLSPAAVTALLDRLEMLGHCERGRSTVDGRRVMVDITSTADATSAHMFTPMNDAIAQALAGYSDQEVELVSQALERLATAMSGIHGSVPAPPQREPT